MIFIMNGKKKEEKKEIVFAFGFFKNYFFTSFWLKKNEIFKF